MLQGSHHNSLAFSVTQERQDSGQNIKVCAISVGSCLNVTLAPYLKYTETTVMESLLLPKEHHSCGLVQWVCFILTSLV